MNRIKDHTYFATCFAGFGYIVLWPLTADEFGAAPLSASVFCYPGVADWLGFLCNSTHPLRLPPGLHALGFISALFATARLLLCLYKRSRRPAPPASALQVVPEAPPLPPRRPRPPLPSVKPRTQFGLRGARH
jgi:hypothetical protein